MIRHAKKRNLIRETSFLYWRHDFIFSIKVLTYKNRNNVSDNILQVIM